MYCFESLIPYLLDGVIAKTNRYFRIAGNKLKKEYLEQAATKQAQILHELPKLTYENIWNKPKGLYCLDDETNETTCESGISAIQMIRLLDDDTRNMRIVLSLTHPDIPAKQKAETPIIRKLRMGCPKGLDNLAYTMFTLEKTWTDVNQATRDVAKQAGALPDWQRYLLAYFILQRDWPKRADDLIEHHKENVRKKAESERAKLAAKKKKPQLNIEELDLDCESEEEEEIAEPEEVKHVMPRAKQAQKFRRTNFILLRDEFCDVVLNFAKARGLIFEGVINTKYALTYNKSMTKKNLTLAGCRSRFDKAQGSIVTPYIRTRFRESHPAIVLQNLTVERPKSDIDINSRGKRTDIDYKPKLEKDA